VTVTIHNDGGSGGGTANNLYLGGFLYGSPFIGVKDPPPTLASLSVSGGTINPVFDPEKLYYVCVVPNGVTNVSISATPESGEFTVEGTGNVDLRVGSNVLFITVKSSTRSTAYQINVARLAQTAGGPPAGIVEAFDYSFEGSFEDHPNIRGVMHNPIVTYNDSIYVVYADKSDPTDRAGLNEVAPNELGRHLMISKIEPDGTVTTTDVSGTAMIRDDFHRAPTVAVDKDGYIHVIGNQRGRTELGWTHYWRSSEPESIESFDKVQGLSNFTRTEAPLAVPSTDTYITYPCFWTDRNGELYITFYKLVQDLPRAGWPAGSDAVGVEEVGGGGLSHYDTETKLWTELGGYGYATDGVNKNQYQNFRKSIMFSEMWVNGYSAEVMQLFFDKDNRMHIVGPGHDRFIDSMGGYPVTSVIYGYSDDGGYTWQKADGSAYATLPMTNLNGDLVVGPEETAVEGKGGEAINLNTQQTNTYACSIYSGGLCVGVGTDGNPIVSYTRYSQVNPLTGNINSTCVYLVRWDGERWSDPVPTNALNTTTPLFYTDDNGVMTGGLAPSTLVRSFDNGETWHRYSLTGALNPGNGRTGNSLRLDWSYAYATDGYRYLVYNNDGGVERASVYTANFGASDILAEVTALVMAAEAAAAEDLGVAANLLAAKDAYAKAESAMRALKNGEEKDALIERLDAVKAVIGAAEAEPLVAAAEEAAAKELNNLTNIAAAVKAYEDALAVVEALGDSAEKIALLERLAAVKFLIDNAPPVDLYTVEATATPLVWPTGRTVITLSLPVDGLMTSDVTVKQNGVVMASSAYSVMIDTINSNMTVMVIFERGAYVSESDAITVTIAKEPYEINGGEPIAITNGIAGYTWGTPTLPVYNEYDFDISAYKTYFTTAEDGPRFIKMADGKDFDKAWFAPGVVFTVYFDNPDGVNVSNFMRMGLRTTSNSLYRIFNGSSAASRNDSAVMNAAQKTFQATYEAFTNPASATAPYIGSLNYFLVFPINEAAAILGMIDVYRVTIGMSDAASPAPWAGPEAAAELLVAAAEEAASKNLKLNVNLTAAISAYEAALSAVDALTDGAAKQALLARLEAVYEIIEAAKDAGPMSVSAVSNALKRPTGRATVTLSEPIDGLAKTDVAVTINGAPLAGEHYAVDIAGAAVMVMFERSAGVSGDDAIEIKITKESYEINGGDLIAVENLISEFTWPTPLWIPVGYEYDFDISDYTTYMTAMNVGPRLVKMSDGRDFDKSWFVEGVVFTVYYDHPDIAGVNMNAIGTLRFGFRTSENGGVTGLYNGGSATSQGTSSPLNAQQKTMQTTYVGLTNGNTSGSIANYHHFVVYNNNADVYRYFDVYRVTIGWAGEGTPPWLDFGALADEIGKAELLTDGIVVMADDTTPEDVDEGEEYWLEADAALLDDAIEAARYALDNAVVQHEIDAAADALIAAQEAFAEAMYVGTWAKPPEDVTLINASTSPGNFVSMTETTKNSRTWVLTFTATLFYSDGTSAIETFSISLSGNNANLDGVYTFGGGHALSGYRLVYDVKGNGSNIKALSLVR